ncbi:MAG: phosphoglycerate mutase (2,3-diphosphoglycerate-independent) [Parcubacteria group bacterium CG1_02_37_51]|uniref:2,3-bisphosphoglycerate-independent phosphoglycerate mutase n=2 Tax=Candidatus Komeiliibacteriota TaxID=1817908 RepID=A0A2M8DSB6_9BACT|nr:MAG: phosphoglycerate mutase (2,3-diphosphoglycerate-independent) [Parcubacteria group bacterium CG1_02_37_51]PIY93949.1 MAG: 2,3-bisphosphoglycerate-independent phosphoglycerate mutase [Candidatus Komeilibacteria bacterium CG_4_10_14_0_8_um_filter_37_78]PJC02238.1 MAG: 2,3-bisphosphoglycerate-independent phosphoglycerate mutase [Candidatus Komeilibacteria bacterium CG_4_9_14_0_8_um_filter_36_9]
MFETRPKPVVLLILDGWGIAAPSKSNVISFSKISNIDSYATDYPTVTLQSAGEAVGLSWGEMGNSEVGHLSIGGGQIIYQNLPRITKSIADKSFYANEEFINACQHVKNNNSNLHLLGLLSNGSVHSYNEHLYALLEVALQQQVKNVFVHVFLDGRDTPYNSGEKFVTKLEEKIKQIGIGKIASVSGRFYAMDRDNHWERTELVYNAMVAGEAKHHNQSAVAAIKESYGAGIYDEELEPVIIINNEDKPVGLVQDNDALIFFNYRSDRARQLTKAFVLPSLDRFSKERPYLNDLYFVTMSEYEKDLPAKIAFPPVRVETPLAAVIAQAGLKQYHVAETEKYAHVTFFFNGGQEAEYEGEERALIPSPRVASYDEVPKMSAAKVTESIIAGIQDDQYDFIVANFANPDMVAHTGNIKATQTAVEFLDENVGKIVSTTLARNGVVLITADHGNAEELFKLRTGEIDKEHSTNPVPLYIIANELKGKTIIPGINSQNLYNQVPAGILADIAPTIIKIMGLKKPVKMTGTSLI